MDKNTTIPAERKQIFSTAADFQTSVTINVLQGERQMAADNVSLGMFNLVGIPPAPRNVPQIEVKFDIDENGILNVTAKDLGTGKEQSITITASTKLDQSEINRMVKEAEQFAEQDKQKKEEVEVRNNADSMIYTSEKTLADLEDKLAKEQKDKIRNAVNELNEALKGEDISQIQAKTEALAKILQEIGTAVYQQVAQEQAAQQPPPGSETETTGTSPPPPGEKVVDADYEVVDDE
jgi:molecular chaperone DnaK